MLYQLQMHILRKQEIQFLLELEKTFMKAFYLFNTSYFNEILCTMKKMIYDDQNFNSNFKVRKKQGICLHYLR